MLFVVCILSWGEVLEDVVHVFRGSLHVSMGSLHVFRGSSFWFVALMVLLFMYRWHGALLASPVRSRYELCSQLILFLSCVGTFDHLWSLCCFIVDFSFIFHMVTVCVVNALIKERSRTRVVTP